MLVFALKDLVSTLQVFHMDLMKVTCQGLPTHFWPPSLGARPKKQGVFEMIGDLFFPRYSLYLPKFG